ncbi:DNA ligase 1-like [Forsythia ovata]|uniref:DNA ligase 1-like n=1 Tax=Forsythia ovata TaxID=205694 RepID=A0ABD1V0X2_9LAMI
MSRCFPFPPPGFEREHRPEDLGALKEEKLKEKTHKKEKKDKERREGKEKRGKERSDEKRKEKKDRKEKHKDKKEKHGEKKKDKEKDREKDREKNSISDESTVAGKLEESTGEKLHSKGQSKIKSSFTDGAKLATQFLDQNRGKPIRNSLLQGTEESKFVQELDWRIRDDEKGTGSQLLNGISGFGKRDQEAASRADIRDSSGVLAEDKGKNKDKRVESRKLDVQGFRKDFRANTTVQNDAGMAKSKVEAMPKPMEEHKDSRLEGKERSKEKNDDNQGDKHKGTDRDKKVHGKDKERKKEKKREEKAKGIIENKKSDQGRSNYVGRNDLVGVTSNTSTHLLMDINGSAVDEGNIRKMKDVSTNGFLHESEVRPNKLQRLTPHQLTENGRKFEACQNPNASAPYKQISPYNICSDNEDQRVTGTLKARELCPSKPKPSTASTTVDQIAETSKKSLHQDSEFPNEVLRVPKVENLIAEASRRPPHPDSKYLSEILTVPKMEELQTDDQEWLFYMKDPPSNKPKVGFWGVREDVCVWSEAMYIESADVYALPYVIPY